MPPPVTLIPRVLEGQSVVSVGLGGLTRLPLTLSPGWGELRVGLPLQEP